jgi:hypothetical protein
MAPKITPVIAPTTPIDQKQKMLQSYANFITFFLQATLDLARKAGGSIQSARADSPQRQVVYYFIADGAVYTHVVDRDCMFLGVLNVYSSNFVTVTTDGSSQSGVVSGAGHRQLPNLIAACSGPAAPLYQRIPVSKGLALYFSVNTGPTLIALVFEPMPI